MKKSLLLLFSTYSLCLLSACGGGAGGSTVATHLSVAASSTAAAGTAFNFTVTALDASNATATGYSGIVHFSSTDVPALLPLNSTLTNGTGTFSATLNTAGSQTITATDTFAGSITGTSTSISVIAMGATHFAIAAPATATAGTAISLSVNALDASNKVTASYSGTVHFTSTDAQAAVPANSTLTNGTGTFSATLKTLGNQTITATDTTTASVTGISSAISVGSAAATHFSLSGPLFGDASPGSSLRLVATALDAANNTAPTYSGTVHFTSTDPLASLPVNSTLTNGSGTFSATLNTVGSQTITATDTVTPSITGASHFSIAKLTITSGAPPNGTVGVAYGSTPSCYSGPGFVLGASGGNPGFRGDAYAWASTSLPPGLQIGKINYVSGPFCGPGGGFPIPVIFGAPTQAGIYHNVVITLHDNETPPATASATYTITIGAAAAASLAAEALSTLDSSTSHHHYKLIDMGTFGGPASYFSGAGTGARVLNNRGTVAGYADTSTPDFYGPPNCWNADCFMSEAFRWQDGAIQKLGALPGQNSSAVTAINDLDSIVGYSQNGLTDPLNGAPAYEPILWKDGKTINLGNLGGYESLAVDINNRGQIIGFSTNGIPDPFDPFGFPTQLRGFIWQNGVMSDLGTLGGPDTQIGVRVNERGQTTGASDTNFEPNPSTGLPTADPFLWENGKMIDLGSFGGTLGFGDMVNNRGQVIGVSDLPGDTTQHAFLWENGNLQDLGTLGGTYSAPNWLNEAGEVVGGATTPGDLNYFAFLWKNGKMNNLGALDGDPCSQGNAINETGQIVGESASCDFLTVQRAFLWERGSMVDLNNLIPSNSSLSLSAAWNINERGEIVGVGIPPGGSTNTDFVGHLFLLIPCDENHPNVEGCDYGMVDPPIGQAPDNLTPSEDTSPENPKLASGSSGLMFQSSSGDESNSLNRFRHQVAFASSVRSPQSLSATTSSGLAITSGTPPNGNLGMSYGPATTETLKCYASPVLGWHQVCTPCSSFSSGCVALPRCRGLFPSPCVKTEVVYLGVVLTATGGLSPYTWSASGLPPSLSLNSQKGLISGIPVTAGTYNLTINVHDSTLPPKSTSTHYVIVISP